VSLSTHVLDTERGRPASGIRVELFSGEERLAEQTTDDDGRIADLAPGLAAGVYRLVFHPPSAFFRRVELEIAGAKDRGALGCPASHQRAEASQQLGERERLGQVVVGAGVQTRDAIGDRVPRGEHQDGAPSPRFAQLPAHLEAVQVGQHQIQDDGVVGVLGPEPHGVLATAGDIDRVALLFERALEQAGHLDLVLHHEHAHRPTA